MVTHIRAPRVEVELAADALWQAGASAVAEYDDGDGDGGVRVVGDVDVNSLPAGLPDHWQVEQHDVIDDGLDAWRPYARAERVGERLVVQPPWAPPLDDLRGDDIVLIIDPARSFGSGSHPTTRLVLAAIERHMIDSARALDVGCGSGVLAVAAARLGAGAVVGVDTDPDALVVTMENARRNDVADRIEVTTRALDAVPGRFDLVVANISAGTVRALAPLLVERAGDRGTIVLSGFLEADVTDVIATFTDADVRDITIDDSWACVVLVRATS